MNENIIGDDLNEETDLYEIDAMIDADEIINGTEEYQSVLWLLVKDAIKTELKRGNNSLKVNYDWQWNESEWTRKLC